jgi:K(+)-stimulated pyrophosphate-energized sodium pump
MDPIVDAVKALLDVPVNAWMAACLGAGVLAVLTALILRARLAGREAATDALQRVGRAVRMGVRGFARTQMAVTAAVALVGAGAIAGLRRDDGAMAAALVFALGCVVPTLAAVLGLRAAAAGGTRCVHAASARGLSASLRTAYASGMVAALFAAGFAVIAIAALFLGSADPGRLVPFALGGSAAALVVRIGGGIFAKAADVGMSLAVRTDRDVPDDSDANPGVIADDVGDAVGDVAGMGADLHESLAAAAAAAMALGATVAGWAEKAAKAETRDAIANLAAGPATLVLFPVAVLAAGVVASLLAAPFAKTENERKVGAVLHRTTMVGAVLFTAGAATLTFVLGLAQPEVTQALTGGPHVAERPWRYDGPAGVLWAVLAGLVLGIGLGRHAEWCSSDARSPARRLAEESQGGPSVNVLSGIALGFASCGWQALMIAATVGVAYFMAGAYGVALAAAGLLGTMVVQLAASGFGAVAANARGIAEIVRAGPETRRRAEALDAAASATGATGRAYATGAAAMTSLALLAAFRESWARLHPGAAELRLDLGDIQVELGLLVGAMLPFLFAATCIGAVGRVAKALSEQIVSAYRESRPLGDRAAQPDHARFVAAGTRNAFRRAAPAALIAVGAPVLCAFSPLGVSGLYAMLVGAIATGTMLSVALSTAGVAWDNARRYVASGVFGGKGSPAYRAAVTGDVVGDPMKDAAAPGLHTLVKLMAMIGLVLVPFLAG